MTTGVMPGFNEKVYVAGGENKGIAAQPKKEEPKAAATPAPAFTQK